ncbi:MAG: hypothetical protein SNJ75_20080 [Gemmataceae bacterium]
MPRCASGLVMLASLWVLVPTVQAQLTPSYLGNRHFEIPLIINPSRAYREFILYSSRDGKNYEAAVTIPADLKAFDFTAPSDGEYFFFIQSKDTFGNLEPKNLNGTVRPLLRVIVDTKMPSVEFEAVEAKDGGAAVQWKIEDPNLDLRTLRLEYRKANEGEWIRLRPKLLDRAHFSWMPVYDSTIDVRLSVADLAGNMASKMVQTKPIAGKDGTTKVSAPGTPKVIHVRSKKFKLHYKLDNVGASRVKHVELWLTRDTQAWVNHSTVDESKLNAPLEIVVPTAGRYGFTLRPVSGVGRAVDPPSIGQPPQIWVEVDETKPIVEIFDVIVGEEGPDIGYMTVKFRAQDKFLREAPITIYHAATKEGPWEILETNLRNSGSVRLSTKDRGFQFFLKVEAIDEAGNRGEAVWPEPVKVDLSKPMVKELSVEGIDVVPDKGLPPR